MTKLTRQLEVARALHEVGKLFLELETPAHLRKQFDRGSIRPALCIRRCARPRLRLWPATTIAVST
jgi:hypothetical protein